MRRWVMMVLVLCMVQQKGISLCPGGSVTKLVPGGGVSGDGDAEKPDEGVDSLQTPVRGNE